VQLAKKTVTEITGKMNKFSAKPVGKNRIATPHGIEWTQPLYAQAVQCTW